MGKKIDPPPTRKSAGDAALSVAKAAVGAIPAAGGPLQTLLETVIAAPIEKRRQQWLKELAEVVSELADKVEGLTEEALGHDEMFVTAVLQATQIALRNHQAEKHEALRNALFNSGSRNAPAEDVQLMFLRFIDELTPWHLRILGVLNDPPTWAQDHGTPPRDWGMGGVGTVIEYCFPELRGQQEFYDQIVNDLQARGLVVSGRFMHVTMTGSGMVQPRTTELGKAFLRFITR